MAERSSLMPFILAAGAGTVGYVFLYRPYAERRAMEAAALRAAEEYQAKHGGSLQDALTAVGAKACQAYAAAHGAPPGATSQACEAVALLAVAATKYAVKYGAKGAKVAGKAIGTAGRDVGKGAKAAGRAARKVLKSFGLGDLNADDAQPWHQTSPLRVHGAFWRGLAGY